MSVKTYKSLGCRIAAGWAETIPDFVPSDDLGVSLESQKQFHAFLRRTAAAIADCPELLGMAEHPDDAYRLGELQNRRPELIAAMRALKRKLDDFAGLLYRIGLHGTPWGQGLVVPKSSLALGGRTVERLSRIGLTIGKRGADACLACQDFPLLFDAWTALARDADGGAPGGAGESAGGGPAGKTGGGPAHVPPVRFTRAMFRRGYPYSRDLLLRLAGEDSGLGALVEYMEDRGYALVCDRDNRLTADWIKSYDPRSASAPLKDSWAERYRGGLSLEYDWIRAEPILIGLRIPRFSELLGRYGDMDAELRSFVASRTKKCNACGYCTQTDKTGRRRPSYIAVESDAGPMNLCTLFPGFGYVWTRIDAEAGRGIEGLLGFADRVLAGSN